MKVIHIVATATLLGFALLGWLIDYGCRSHNAMVQRKRQEIAFLKTHISELESDLKNLRAKMLTFPQPSPPSSSSECAFDIVNGVCTLKGNLRVNGKLSASQGNEDNEDQSKSDSDAPDLRL
jgi:hypothetical protein